MNDKAVRASIESLLRGPLEPVGRRSWMKGVAALFGGAATATLAAPASASGIAPGPFQDRSSTLATPADAIVETTAGRVRGYTRNGIYVYKGIPYGDTTAGENRFLPPRKPQPWTGVRSAMAWGPVSPHAFRTGWLNDQDQFLMQWSDGFAGEDMLRINVWTPRVNDGGRRAVMVWVHGGGFTSGSSQELWYDGENLARRSDVVLVSMNHRLNVFGHLDLSRIGGEKYAASGNAGMLDLVQALEWVRDNIGRFGGDPGNVTIFGQSGGAAKVTTLMAMPAAKGLFHRAIVQSSSTVRVSTPEYAERLADAVLAELGLDRSRVAELHRVPMERLLAAGMAAPAKLGGTLPADVGRSGYQPVVDGRILPRHPFHPTAPAESAAVPLLVGSARDEASPSKTDEAMESITEAAVRERLAQRYAERGGALYDAYRRVHPNAKPVEILGWATSAYNPMSFLHAERKAAQGAAPAYHYLFAWHTKMLDGRPRSFHTSEIPFAFYNVDAAENYTGNTAEAWAVAAQVSDAWTSFAKTGDPNHSGIPHWPAFTPARGETMVFDVRSEVRNDPDGEARRALTSLILR